MKTHLTNWIDHVKKFASQNNKKYSECLKDPKCRDAYHRQKGKPSMEMTSTKKTK